MVPDRITTPPANLEIPDEKRYDSPIVPRRQARRVAAKAATFDVNPNFFSHLTRPAARERRYASRPPTISEPRSRYSASAAASRCDIEIDRSSRAARKAARSAACDVNRINVRPRVAAQISCSAS